MAASTSCMCSSNCVGRCRAAGAASWLAVLVLVVWASPLQVVRAQSARFACPLADRFCQLQPRFSFGAAALGDKVYYHGGLDANNGTRPWADDVLEVVDVDTLEAYPVTLSPGDSKFSTRRYRHLMAARGGDLLLLGGQVDDKNGISVQTMNVLDLDVTGRTWNLIQNFSTGGDKLDLILGSIEQKNELLSFTVTTVPLKNATDGRRVLQYLNFTTNKMSEESITPAGSNLQFLIYQLVTHWSLRNDGRPPYLVLEARNEIVSGPSADDDPRPPLVASVHFRDLAGLPGKDTEGPITLNLQPPKGIKLAVDAAAGQSGGKTLAMQLLPASKDAGDFNLVFWTRSLATWGCGGSSNQPCPEGITSGRAVPVSMVSIWRLRADDGPNPTALPATLRHLLVGVPPGLSIGQLATLQVPQLGTIKAAPELIQSGLLAAMPYVGSVDIGTLDSDENSVVITPTPKGFLARGTASAPNTCSLWRSGQRPFILKFTVGSSKAPGVTGGSLYTAGCAQGDATPSAVMEQITKTQWQAMAGTGMYEIPAGPGQAKCFTWDPPARKELNNFVEYDKDGQPRAIVMDPTSQAMQVQPIKLPAEYPYATSRSGCVFKDADGSPVYLEYGGQPLSSKGKPSQTPVSAVYAMRLNTPGSAPWEMKRVDGDGALPQRAAAGMACGPEGVAYIFGGVEDQTPKATESRFAPTSMLMQVKVTSGGDGSYSLQAKQLQAGKGPVARSNHVLVYLPPGMVIRLGMPQGALLLHGGSNLNNTRFQEASPTDKPYQEGFQMYNDTWLFDLARNSWTQLPSASTAQPLMWHAACVAPSKQGDQVVMFGGATFVNTTGTTGQFDQSLELLMLDLTVAQPTWRSTLVNITGWDALKVIYPNSGICAAAGGVPYLIRQRKSIHATPAPRSTNIPGSSKDIVAAWNAQSANMATGDVIKLSAPGNTLVLTQPLMVPAGVTVMPGSNSGRVTKSTSPSGRRLQQSSGAIRREPLTIFCSGSKSAFVITSPGVILQDLVIRNCSAQAINITAEAAGGGNVTLQRVNLTGNSGEQGAAINIAEGAAVTMLDCNISRNNANGTGSAVYAADRTNLQLVGTSVQFNKGTGLEFLGTNLVVKNSNFTGNSAENSGGAVNATASEGGLVRAIVNVTGSMFVGNSARRGGGGAILLGPGAVLALTDVSLYRNTAPVGGAIQGLPGSCLRLARSVNFTGNRAIDINARAMDINIAATDIKANGGALALQGPRCDDAAGLQLHQVTLTNNTAGGSGGGLHITDVPSMRLSMINSTFVGNKAQGNTSTASGMGGAVHAAIWSSTLTLQNCNFSRNAAGDAGGGVHIFSVNSRLTVVNNRFVENMASPTGTLPTSGLQAPTQGGGLMVTGASAVSAISNSVFIRNGASSGAGVYFGPTTGQLNLTGNSSFVANQAGSQGGGLVVANGAALLAVNAMFENNTARAADGTGGGLCCLRCRSVELTLLRFINNNASYGAGAAVLQPSRASAVQNCQFVGNTAVPPNTSVSHAVRVFDMSWSAVNMQPAQVPVVVNTTVDSGAYLGGGGLYASPQATFNLSGSTFDNNMGVNGGGVLAITDSCPATPAGSTTSTGCMRLFDNNVFTGNLAKGGAGGAVLVTNVTRVTCVAGDTGKQAPLTGGTSCVTAGATQRHRHLLQAAADSSGAGGSQAASPRQNLAQGGYGDTLATAATSMYLSSDRFCSSSPVSEVPRMLRVAPGRTLTTRLMLRDALRQCVFGDISDASMLLRARLRFLNGTNAEQMPLLGNSTQAQNGTAVFNALQVSAQPGDYHLEIRSPSSDLLKPLLLNLTVRACVAGEYTETKPVGFASYNCINCTAGSYSFDGNRTECSVCNTTEHADCSGAAKVPLSGYYQSHPRNPQVYPCLWSGACARSLEDITAMRLWADLNAYKTVPDLNATVIAPYMAPMCSPGYTGPLCGSCTPDHGRRGFQCGKCLEPRAWDGVLYLMVWLYCAAAVVLAAYLHMKQVQRRHGSRNRDIMQQVLSPLTLASAGQQPREHRRVTPQPYINGMDAPTAQRDASNTSNSGAANGPTLYRPVAAASQATQSSASTYGTSPLTNSSFSSPTIPRTGSSSKAPPSTLPAHQEVSEDGPSSDAALVGIWAGAGVVNSSQTRGGLTVDQSTGARPATAGSWGSGSDLTEQQQQQQGSQQPPAAGAGGRPVGEAAETEEHGWVGASSVGPAGSVVRLPAQPLGEGADQPPMSDADGLEIWGSVALQAQGTVPSAAGAGTDQPPMSDADGLEIWGSTALRAHGIAPSAAGAGTDPPPTSDADGLEIWGSTALRAQGTVPSAGAAAGGANGASAGAGSRLTGLATAGSDAGMHDIWRTAGSQFARQQQADTPAGNSTATSPPAAAAAGSAAASSRPGMVGKVLGTLSRLTGANSSGTGGSSPAELSSYESTRGRPSQPNTSGHPSDLAKAPSQRTVAGHAAATAAAAAAAAGATGARGRGFGAMYALPAGQLPAGRNDPQASGASYATTGPVNGGSMASDARPPRDILSSQPSADSVPSNKSLNGLVTAGGEGGKLPATQSSFGITRSGIWDRLLGVDDLDREDCLRVASEASYSQQSTAAAGLGPDVSVFERRNMFYIIDIIKLAITHLQMLGIMRLMGLSWPVAAEDILTYSDQTLPIIGWINLDCALWDSPGLPRSLKRVLVQLLVPVGSLLVMVAFWGLLALWHRRRGLAWTYAGDYRPRMVLCTVLIMFFLYPSVTNVLVGMFKCTRVDVLEDVAPEFVPLPGVAQYPHWYWLGDTQVQCWTGAHLYITAILAAPYFLVFSVGFPVALILLLYKRRHCLGDRVVELQYGFLYESYHIRQYYWESVVLFQKLVLVVLVMMLQRQGQGLQVLVAMCVITAASILQITLQPFACRMLDTLNRASLHVLQITLFLLMISALAEVGGITPLAMGKKNDYNWVVLLIIVVFNGALLLLFGFCAVMETRRLVRRTLGKDSSERVTWADLWSFARSLMCGSPGGKQRGDSASTARAAGPYTQQQEKPTGAVQAPQNALQV